MWPLRFNLGHAWCMSSRWIIVIDYFQICRHMVKNPYSLTEQDSKYTPPCSYCPHIDRGFVNLWTNIDLIYLNMDVSMWGYSCHDDVRVLQQDGLCPGFFHGWTERRWAGGQPLCICSDPCKGNTGQHGYEGTQIKKRHSPTEGNTNKKIDGWNS